MNITISARKSFVVLLLTASALTAAHLGVHFLRAFLSEAQLAGWLRLFDLDLENNLPTLFATLILLSSGILLGFIYLVKRRRQESFFLYWLGLALAFLYLAMDEWFGIHERLIRPLRGILDTSGPLRNPWVIPYGLALALLGILYLRFILALPPRTRRLMILAALIFLGGGLILEMVGGAYNEIFGRDLISILISTVEEFSEFLGVSIFIYALIGYIESWDKGFRLVSRS